MGRKKQVKKSRAIVPKTEKSVGRPSMDEMVKFKYWTLTPKQHQLLTRLAETGDVNTACNEVGMNKWQLGQALSGKKETPFVKAYNNVMEGLARNHDFSKVGNLQKLNDVVSDMKDRMLGAEDTKSAASAAKVLLQAIAEINKMQEGNLAVKKSSHEEKKIEFKVGSLIDLSKPAYEEEEEKEADEETDYIDITDE